jgi:hypothetical protein
VTAGWRYEVCIPLEAQAMSAGPTRRLTAAECLNAGAEPVIVDEG